MTDAGKRKIGILTFHKSINYGSVLQAWALQKTLQRFSSDVRIIDYEPIPYDQMYGLFKKASSKADCIYNVKILPIAYFIKRQIDSFAKFREKELSLTNHAYYSVEELEKDCANFDTLICGSDQIWNVHARDCDDSFFLPFEFQGKKIAYAVSVNNTDFTEERCDNQLREDIRDFSAISCREESGSKKISRFIDCKNVFTALDPTLLLEKSQYDEICSPRIINHEYIFLYNVWDGGDALSIAKMISTSYKKPVYTMLTKKRVKSILKVEKNGVHVLKMHSAPGDFLSLIKYADFVISDSFHGTAFSLIYEKQFISVNQREGIDDSSSLRNDERLVNILETLGLKSRLVSIYDKDKILNLDYIDYTLVTPQRMDIAKQSTGWLAEKLA